MDYERCWWNDEPYELYERTDTDNNQGDRKITNLNDQTNTPH